MTETEKTILVVDDDREVREVVLAVLEGAGYRVIEADTGEEAITIARRERPDLIIMDMMMPGMNGLDATQEIRQDQALCRTPIVAVSAYGVNEYRRLALDAGCDEYVSTPFEPNALAEIIASLLAAQVSSSPDVHSTKLAT